jgi:hypothetical protein
MPDPLGGAVITSVSPSSLMQGVSQTVTINGYKTNFSSASVVTCSNDGVTVSDVALTSATVLTATLTIDRAAALGPCDVTVTTGGEVATGAGKLTVLVIGPTVFISPDSAMRGTVDTVQINGNGTHFDATSVVSFSGGGITLSAVTVLSSTTLRASMTIDPSADLGPCDVIVTTGTEVATEGVFTVIVNPSLTKITEVSPNTGVRGAIDLTVDITGQNTHFDATSVVSFAGGGITISAYSLVSPTAMQATISILDSAALGSSSVTVTTGHEVATGPNIFTVEGIQVPALISVQPSSAAQGGIVPVEITGQQTHFDDTSVLSFSGDGITVSDVVATSATSLTATLTVDDVAPSGPSDVTVTTGAEIVTGTGFFAVVGSTAEAEVLREAVNTYLRQNHVTDPAAVAICEEFIANVNEALRGVVAGKASGIKVGVRLKR